MGSGKWVEVEWWRVEGDGCRVDGEWRMKSEE